MLRSPARRIALATGPGETGRIGVPSTASITNVGALPRTVPYSHSVGTWGSLPTTDDLQSDGHFEMVHEGAGHSRTEEWR